MYLPETDQSNTGSYQSNEGDGKADVAGHTQDLRHLVLGSLVLALMEEKGG